MAKKSKGFSELLKQQRIREAEQDVLEKLQQKIRQDPVNETIPELLMTPKDEVKMSEVLKAFVTPYLNRTSNPQQRKILFDLAVFAWNLALIPEHDQQSMIDLEQSLKHIPQLNQQDLREFIDELIARKHKFFANNQYLILNYELQEKGKECQIAVASKLMNQPAAE